MKIIFKILLIILMSIYISASMPKNISNATKATDKFTISDRLGWVKPDMPEEKKYSEISSLIGKILGFLQVVSGFCAVLVIAFTGFQFLFDPPPEFKKELKAKMLPLLIGIVLIFGAVSITKFLLSATKEKQYIATPEEQYFKH